MTRRDALGLGAAATVAGLVGGCRPVLRQVVGDDLPARLTPPSGRTPRHVRLMNRVGFGPRPGDDATIDELGIDAFLERQLAADQPEPLDLDVQLHRLDVLRMDAMELRDIREEEIIRQLQQAALLRAVYSPNQLRERMVDFWSNHFSIYVRKGYGAFRKGRDETEVVRRHALGSFPDMLRASAKSPAMLVYLDNTANDRRAPNENYARELLELHTLGVDGGYTQKDIQEVARCFSGWTLEEGFLRPRGKLRFDPEAHDDGAKLVLGRRIPAGLGPKDVDVVLDVLIAHPSTARFLARKLVRSFIGEPVPELEAQVAAAYARSGGNIPVMLRAILASPLLLEGPPVLKRPFDFLVSALRATDADTPANRSLQDALRRMGQPTYEWPMPDGYPLDFDAWSGSLLDRWNTALDLAEGRMPDVRLRLMDMRGRFDGDDVSFFCMTFFGRRADAPEIDREVRTLQQALARTPELADRMRIGAAICLCSPTFQWR